MSKPEDTTPKQAEVAKKGLAVSRGEVILVVLFVLAGVFGSFLIDRAAGWAGRSIEPRESGLLLDYGVPSKQDALSMTRREQTATEESLIKSRLELYEREAALAALEASRPEEGASAEARLKRDSAARHKDALVSRLGELQRASDSLRREVEERSRLAARDFGLWHVAYKVVKALVVFALTLALLWFVYWLLTKFRLLKRYTEAVRAGDGLFLLKAVGGLLVILVAYQAFQVAGAALAAAVVLLLILKGFYEDKKASAAGEGAT